MKKKNRNKFIASIVITGIVSYFIVFPVIDYFKYSYDVVFHDIDEYKFLFRNPTALDTLFSGIGQIRDTDKNYSYLTNDGYYIEIYEFRDINKFTLDQVEFDFIKNIPNDNEWVGRQLNSDLNGVPLVTIKNQLIFNNTLYVDFNKNAPLEVLINEPNCRVYYGSLLKMVLSGQKREPFVLYDFKDVTKTIIAFYKTKYRFLLIIVTSDNPIKNEDLNIFKFEYQ